MKFSQEFLDTLKTLLLNQNFLDRVIFLILTAGVSGLFIPHVLKGIDARKLRAKMEYEADLKRSANIVDAQINLLENISKSLWELQLLALAVCYYKVHSNSEKYIAAVENYDVKSWDLFSNIRLEISKAARLVSNDLYNQLLCFFEENLIKRIDETLMPLIEKGDDTLSQEWEKQYDFLLYKLPIEIDEIVITPLAEELKLSSPQKNKPKSRR
ncbi:hypothetical protein [Mastigocoleus testarum]|uniref:Uncharacterized protein n=1 Tax=Mastigocoleus testarum BC008 TaxID=371196 RepID=A0A0V7ZNP2_9CYAN|nr:hypothetical protein [Mastigocoleus testarum]KST66336.1 hypothetical protein BC008_25515 [Mastigocoleus testarum BC008]KST66657.1 hypothetical protein BC008_26040 [Mastigocoleus testarum BC008]